MSLNLDVQFAQTDKQLEDVFYVRREVFVKEQGIPLYLAQDEYEDISKHIITYHDGLPIATGRIRVIDSSVAKVDQVCVLPDFRRQQVGVKMMAVLEDFALHHPEATGINKIKIYAQAHAVPFYEAQNYKITSPEFIDGGAAYRAMEKDLL